MITFHSRQSDCTWRARKNKNASTINFASQIASSICTVAFKKCEKFDATFLSRGAVACHWLVIFDRGKPNPLSGQGFYGSPIARRKLRGIPRDGHLMGAKHPARNPAKYLAAYPRNVPAMAGQWQQQCRRTPAKTTRKTTCLAPNLDALCPRRKLARQLATWPRNSRATSRKMTRPNPAVMLSTIPF
jgi:hypothetical protein